MNFSFILFGLLAFTFLNLPFLWTVYQSFQSHLDQQLKETTIQLNTQPGSFMSESSTPVKNRKLPTWLVIAINTIDRKKGYLLITIASIYEQILKGGGGIKVVVLNHTPNRHYEFIRAKEKYNHTDIYFVDNYERMLDLHSHLPEPDDANNPTDRPNSRVRQQTLDIITLLRREEVQTEKDAIVLFLEDDFELCGGALPALRYLIEKANWFLPDWLVLRTSFGFNGILFRVNVSNSLADYLLSSVEKTPPDLLLPKWVCWNSPLLNSTSPSLGEGQCIEEISGEKRRKRSVTFRYNLMKHMGKISSLRNITARKFPVCWQEYSLVLGSDEAFPFNMCPIEDIHPCNYNPTDVVREISPMELSNLWVEYKNNASSFEVYFEPKVFGGNRNARTPMENNKGKDDLETLARSLKTREQVDVSVESKIDVTFDLDWREMPWLEISFAIILIFGATLRLSCFVALLPQKAYS